MGGEHGKQVVMTVPVDPTDAVHLPVGGGRQPHPPVLERDGHALGHAATDAPVLAGVDVRHQIQLVCLIGLGEQLGGLGELLQELDLVGSRGQRLTPVTLSVGGGLGQPRQRVVSADPGGAADLLPELGGIFVVGSLDHALGDLTLGIGDRVTVLPGLVEQRLKDVGLDDARRLVTRARIQDPLLAGSEVHDRGTDVTVAMSDPLRDCGCGEWIHGLRSVGLGELDRLDRRLARLRRAVSRGRHHDEDQDERPGDQQP